MRFFQNSKIDIPIWLEVDLKNQPSSYVGTMVNLNIIQGRIIISQKIRLKKCGLIKSLKISLKEK